MITFSRSSSLLLGGFILLTSISCEHMYISYDKYVCHVIQVNLHSSTGLLIFTKRPMKIEQECLLSNDSLASAFFQCTCTYIFS